MLRQPEPTTPRIARPVPILTTGSARSAVASYTGRLARRRVTRRGTCPSALDAARRAEVVK